MKTSTVIAARMVELADPLRAAGLQRFFKTAPGQYGEGDRFLGLALPQIRALEREFRDLPLAEVERLLESSWHEARVLAVVILANAYPRAREADKQRIYTLYLRRTDRVNNWDLVDLSAPHIVGAHLLERSRAPLRRLARSSVLWERRIAIVATQSFIRRDQFTDTLAIAKILMKDRHDLIHKAVGWMLREVGKRDESVLRAFLDAHAGSLPRTALRYSLERLPPRVRQRYMSA